VLLCRIIKQAFRYGKKMVVNWSGLTAKDPLFLRISTNMKYFIDRLHNYFTPSLVLCICFVDLCLSFCSFSLAIMLSILLRYTDYDYPFGIFKLFIHSQIFYSKGLTSEKAPSINGRWRTDDKWKTRNCCLVYY
jgi:hypothetical protein